MLTTMDGQDGVEVCSPCKLPFARHQPGRLWIAAWKGGGRGADSGALHFDGVLGYAKKM